MNKSPTVFIVDDDFAVRDSLGLLMQAAGLAAEEYPAAMDFLRAVPDDRPGCLILDVRMPEVDGLELQRQLAVRGSRMPIIILTGHGDVPMAVQALRAGAFNFLQKPFDSQQLLQSVREAIELDARMRASGVSHEAIRKRLAVLTPRETQVLELIVGGLHTKAIAAKLGSSFNTVQNQRASILKKMSAESVADLVRMVMMVRQ